MRGGTSKGAVFRASDLPLNERTRNRILAAVMGGLGELQVDGIGGGHPLSNKVAIVALSSEAGVDIDYLFLQVCPVTGSVDTTQNCGNMLAATGPFAITEGLIAVEDSQTRVRVRMLNSGNLCELTVQTPGGCVEYEGDTEIDGVPGTSAPIICDYLDVAGSACGSMLPTGRAMDFIDGVDVTLIDNGMPVVVVRAGDLGITGVESPAELESNSKLVAAKESIRLQAGMMMGLGDVSAKTVPKVSLVSSPVGEGVIATRTFIPHSVHMSIGVLGAASIATACLLPGTVAEDLTQGTLPGADGSYGLGIEHPSGALQINIRACSTSAGLRVERVGVVRTARLLFRGEVCVPTAVWTGHQKKGQDIRDAANA